MKPNACNQSNVILRPGNGRMKPVLLPPGPSSATFLILSCLRCLQELLGCRCLLSPSMCLGAGKLPCTPLPSTCTMSCEWGIWHHLWSGAACSIPPQQGSPLLGALHSSHFPMPHDLLSPAMVASSKWLVCGSSCPTLPDLPGLGEALPSGSQSPGWLASCLSETPVQLVEWLAAHPSPVPCSWCIALPAHT